MAIKKTIEVKRNNQYSPLRAIRRYCVDWCMCRQDNDVKLCDVTDCPLHQLRLGRKVPGIRPLKQIRLKCLDCSGGNPYDVKDCYASDKTVDTKTIFQGTYCQLYIFRFGKNPRLAGKISKKGLESIKKFGFKKKAVLNTIQECLNL